MKTSAEKILSNIELSYENICKLLLAFDTASKTNNNNIEVELKDKTGKITKYKISSFYHIINELQRIDNNFKSLLNTENQSYILNGDGSINQITKTSFLNCDYFDFSKLTINNTDLIIDNNSPIKNFLFPNIKLPIVINNDKNLPLSDINCLMFDIQTGHNHITNGIKLVQLKYLIESGKVTINSENEFTLKPEKNKVKYFGEFSITNVEKIVNHLNTNNEFKLFLDDVKYSSINSLEKNIPLKEDDLVATKNGNSLFQVTSVDLNLNVIIVKRIKGIDTPKIGVNNLLFNEVLPSNDEFVVGVPIKPNKKIVVFLSPENIKTKGFPSDGLFIDTSSYEITYNNQTLTLENFFSKYVTNFSDYLISVIKDTTIPYSLGIKPKPVVLLENNFNVIQINKHLTASKSAIELQKFNERKENIKNSIEYKQTQINNIQNELDTTKYKTLEEKRTRIEQINSLKNEINLLNQNYLNATRDIDSNAIKSGLKNVKPKYKLIGFWELHKPIMSSNTKAQHIIGYEIQYRYLSKNLENIDSTVLKMYDKNNNEINIAVSPWNIIYSETLKKVENIDGSTDWVIPKLDSVEEVNINQCAISISEGESIEVRVRAISEAGYPISPMVSDWSNIIRYDFPQGLIDESLFAMVEQNNNDLKIAELKNILDQEGILKHIANQVTEAEKIFAHKAEDITSGFFTPEMTNIPLHVYLRTLTSRLDILEKIENSESATITVVDFNGEEYKVIDNSTVELNGGSYGDNFNLLDKTKFGSIIRKRGFIKIRNNSQLPIELKSLVPSEIFNDVTAPNYYNVPVKITDVNNNGFSQASKQIIYFRDTDISNQSNNYLFRLNLHESENVGEYSTAPNPNLIDDSVTDDKKDIIYMSGTTVNKCKLKPNSPLDFNGFTTEHPYFKALNQNNKLSFEFNRIKYYTDIVKKNNIQYGLSKPKIVDENNNTVNIMGFHNNDFYSIGKNTCGAFLYPIFPNLEQFKVVGNTTQSTLIIPKETELIIPIMFEYRMIDRLGNVDGDYQKSINDNIIYTKKLGVDMLINNHKFSFDISATAKLKTKISQLDKQNLNSIIGAFKTNNNKNSLI